MKDEHCARCPTCNRPMNIGNSPNEFECTETDDDEGVCAAYAKIAALQQTIRNQNFAIVQLQLQREQLCDEVEKLKERLDVID